MGNAKAAAESAGNANVAADITVTVTGRQGVNDCINSVYSVCGEHDGRFCFTAQAVDGEPPIYLYYDQATDNWCIGDQVGSQSYYAVCGPSNGHDMGQEWRMWNGQAWEADPKVTATIS